MGEPSRKGLWGRFRRIIHGNFIEPLVNSRHPPWFDARGVAVGLVVGFGVPVGGHFVALAILRAIFGFNFIVAFAFTWVCNPFNMILVYYGYYLLGSVVVGKPAALGLEDFGNLLTPIIEMTYFWEALSAFLQLGKDLLVRWYVAAAMISVVSGVIGYVVTYRVQKLRCRRTAEKLGVKYEKFLEELESGPATGPT
ncbi:MAG: DUF2062 domain-containing protein [Desulfomonile tiedjei]|nr:DUF2062 domain-containing protein [Desulfomonile tiedjei]